MILSSRSIVNFFDIFLCILCIFVRISRAVNKEGMSRLPKRMQQQVKRVAPPAVPETYRHSGSSFSSAGYGSCDDTTAIFVPTRNTTNSSNNNSSSLDQTDSINRAAMQSNSSTANSGWILS